MKNTQEIERSFHKTYRHPVINIWKIKGIFILIRLFLVEIGFPLFLLEKTPILAIFRHLIKADCDYFIGNCLIFRLGMANSSGIGKGNQRNLGKTKNYYSNSGNSIYF